jgi:hypothetical protein
MFGQYRKEKKHSPTTSLSQWNGGTQREGDGGVSPFCGSGVGEETRRVREMVARWKE